MYFYCNILHQKASHLSGIGTCNLNSKCQIWNIIRRKKMKLFDIHPSKIREFQTFTFFFRVFQFRCILLQNKFLQPLIFNRREPIWWDFIQVVHCYLTNTKARAMTLMLTLPPKENTLFVDYTHLFPCPIFPLPCHFCQTRSTWPLYASCSHTASSKSRLQCWVAASV